MNAFALLLLVAAPATQPEPVATQAEPVATRAEPPTRLTTPLMERFAGRVVARASSEWAGWPAARLVDGDGTTSWFSAMGDAAANGKRPWVELAFPEAITVSSVAVRGNREPSWPRGFSIHYGLLELLDDNGAVVASVKNEGKNTAADIDFKLKKAVAGVRVVRFTSLMDDGDKTQFKDIALAEVLVDSPR